jgi:hypothetical protein
MGYETIMHVGEVGFTSADEDRRYFSLVASIDLSKPGYDSAVYKLATGELGTPVYIYAANGNDRLTVDCYDRELVAVDATAAIAALKKDTREKDPYRRFIIALALLESAVERFDKLQVVFYGH